jgi:hypothetical protein
MFHFDMNLNLIAIEMILRQGWGLFHLNSSQFRKYTEILIQILLNAFQRGNVESEFGLLSALT